MEFKIEYDEKDESKGTTEELLNAIGLKYRFNNVKCVWRDDFQIKEYFVEVNSIEDLLKIMRTFDEQIVISLPDLSSPRWEGYNYPTIQIYNSYIE